jgi:hypothetical protein
LDSLSGTSKTVASGGRRRRAGAATTPLTVPLRLDFNREWEGTAHLGPDSVVSRPVLDACEVARRPRAALGGGVVLIALAGFGESEDRRRALATGFDHYLTEPVHPQELLRLLRPA